MQRAGPRRLDAIAPGSRRAACASTCQPRCRCCPATASSCARAAGARRSAAARSSTSRRCCPASKAAGRIGRRRPGRRRAGLDRRRRARGADRRAPAADRRAVGGRARRGRGDGRRPRRPRIAAAGPLGLDVAALDERERAVLGRVPDVDVADGRARPVGRAPTRSPTTPSWLRCEAAGVAPAAAGRRRPGRAPRAGAPGPGRRARRRLLRAERRRRGRRDRRGRLLARQPDGFTVAQLRDALGITRKYAAAAAQRARRPRHHPPPRRPPHRRAPPPDAARPDRRQPGPLPSSSSSSRGGLRRDRPKSRRRAPALLGGFDRPPSRGPAGRPRRSLVMTSPKPRGRRAARSGCPRPRCPRRPTRRTAPRTTPRG